jgi:ferredoxin
MTNSSAEAVVIDREICMGLGMCIVYAGATFAHDDDAKAYVKDLAGNTPDQIRVAVEACPMGALSLISEVEGA